MKLEICPTGKVFGKSCIKVIRDTWRDEGEMRWGMKEKRRTQFLGAQWHPTEGWGSNIWAWVVRALFRSPIKTSSGVCLVWIL